MPIPNADRAIVAAEKVRDYLLNPDHPDGGSKAVLFQALGYDRSAWELLAADLLAIARDCTDFDSVASRYGVKYIAQGIVGRLGSRIGAVLTVWIVEDEDQPRLVTAYPDDSE